MSEDGTSTARLGEFQLIHGFFAPLATSPGAFALTDDGALFDVPAGEACVVTTDAMVAGVHFFETDPAPRVGWKLLAVNLSDLAAMGAGPLGYTLDLVLPRDWPMDWVGGLAAGLRDCQERYGVSLMGGDTVSTSGPLTLAVTAFGSVPKGQALRRAGAKVGDTIWVSGSIGDAALALKIRKGEVTGAGSTRVLLDRRLDMPSPRVALGKALRGIATAALDVSDGLVADLGHICETSNVGAELWAADVPLSAEARGMVDADPDLIGTILTGGDDYELVFTAPASADDAVRAASEAASTPAFRIGRIVAGQGVNVHDAAGNIMALERLGFAHF